MTMVVAISVLTLLMSQSQHAAAVESWDQQHHLALIQLGVRKHQMMNPQCKPQVDCDIKLDMVDISNLDGALPGPKQIRWTNVCTYKGKVLDFVLAPNGDYDAKKPWFSGSEGTLGRLSLDAGENLKGKFSFRERGTNTLVTVSSFYFTFFDSDTPMEDQPQTESIQVSGYKSYFTGAGSELSISEAGNTLTCNYTEGQGGLAETPADPMALTLEQEKRTLTLYFENVAKFPIQFGVYGPSPATISTRNFMFGGASTLIPECPKPTPPPPPICYEPRSCWWDFSKLRIDSFKMASNPPTMRVETVCNTSDIPYAMDVLITGITPYVANRDDRNGYAGDAKNHGLINIKSGSSLTVEFTLVKSDSPAEFCKKTAYVHEWGEIHGRLPRCCVAERKGCQIILHEY